MADKDKSEKKLEDYNDVFADIINVLLFKSELVKPEQLLQGPTESVYKAENLKLKLQQRDTIKYYKNSGIILANIGIENQSTVDEDMPIRIMGYDYTSYRNQLENKNGLYPVITIVLNFSDKKWNKPVNLKGILNIPEELEPFVEDYKIKVFDIAFLEDEIINKFKSTFKHVAHFFKNKKDIENYQPLDEEIEHLEAFLDLLKVFTADDTYGDIKSDLLESQRKGQVVTMCSVVDRFTNEGLKRGIEQGITQGIEQGITQGIAQEQQNIIINMHNKKCSADVIADLTGIHIDTVNKVIGKNL